MICDGRSDTQSYLQVLNQSYVTTSLKCFHLLGFQRKISVKQMGRRDILA